MYREVTYAERREILRLLGYFKRPPAKVSPLTFKEIAERVGVAESTVGKEAYAKGIKHPSRKGLPGIGRPKGPGKQWSPNRAAVLELWAEGEGKTPSEIAKQLEMTPAGVRRIIALHRQQKSKSN